MEKYLKNGMIVYAKEMTYKDYDEKYNSEPLGDYNNAHENGYFYEEDDMPCWMEKESFENEFYKIHNDLEPLLVFNNKHVDAYRDEKANNYVVSKKGNQKQFLCVLHFQDQVFEKGVNGVTIEDLLYIARDRLIKFQDGELACEYNKNAIKDINSALKELDKRTEDRKKRGVEGKMKK